MAFSEWVNGSSWSPIVHLWERFSENKPQMKYFFAEVYTIVAINVSDIWLIYLFLFKSYKLTLSSSVVLLSFPLRNITLNLQESVKQIQLKLYTMTLDICQWSANAENTRMA